MAELTPRQRLFVAEYQKDLNAQQAASDSGAGARGIVIGCYRRTLTPKRSLLKSWSGFWCSILKRRQSCV